MARLPHCASVKSVEVLDAYRVRIRFRDGCVKVVDLEEVLQPREGLAKKVLDDMDYFRTVHVDGNALCWDNGLDVCSDLLRFHLKTTWMEQHPEFKTTRKSYLELPVLQQNTKGKSQFKASSSKSTPKPRAARSLSQSKKKSSPRA